MIAPNQHNGFEILSKIKNILKGPLVTPGYDYTQYEVFLVKDTFSQYTNLWMGSYLSPIKYVYYRFQDSIDTLRIVNHFGMVGIELDLFHDSFQKWITYTRYSIIEFV